MHGTGAIEINRNVIYAFYARNANEFRLRISIDEWVHLRLNEGEWVEVVLPWRRPERVLLASWKEMPPWTWLWFERLPVPVTAGADLQPDAVR